MILFSTHLFSIFIWRGVFSTLVLDICYYYCFTGESEQSTEFEFSLKSSTMILKLWIWKYIWPTCCSHFGHFLTTVLSKLRFLATPLILLFLCILIFFFNLVCFCCTYRKWLLNWVIVPVQKRALTTGTQDYLLSLWRFLAWLPHNNCFAVSNSHKDI